MRRISHPRQNNSSAMGTTIAARSVRKASTAGS